MFDQINYFCTTSTGTGAGWMTSTVRLLAFPQETSKNAARAISANTRIFFMASGLLFVSMSIKTKKPGCRLHLFQVYSLILTQFPFFTRMCSRIQRTIASMTKLIQGPVKANCAFGKALFSG